MLDVDIGGLSGLTPALTLTLTLIGYRRTFWTEEGDQREEAIAP